ncbi:MAG: response regulator [Turicibacter sp.]|nr:response regulator [Turicibacter sp.]
MSKYRVLIADDEQRICSLIQVLGKWEDYQMEVVGKTHNGPSTIEAIHLLKPDIVLTDIRMPGCDGLEIIKQSRQKEEAIEFIVVSGYKHFDYAKSAIKLGVTNYLTKPIDPDELNFSLKQVRDLLQKKQGIFQKLEKTLHLEEESKQRLRRDSLQLAIDKPSVLPDSCFNIQEGLFSMALLKVDGISEIRKSTHIDNIIKHLLTLHLKDFMDWEYVYREDKYFIWIHHGLKQGVAVPLKKIIEDFSKQENILKGIQITIGTSLFVDTSPYLFNQVVQARQALNERIILGCNQVINFSEIKTSTVSMKQLLGQTYDEFKKAIEFQNKFGVRAALEDLKKNVHRTFNLSASDIGVLIDVSKEIYLQSVKTLLLISPEFEEEFLAQYQKVEQLYQLEEITSHITETIFHSFSKLLYLVEQQESRPVMEAKNFINQHYHDSLTLDFVSEQVGYSSSHISHLFKKTGLTFSEYLQQVRLEHAKKHLRETRMTVAAICESVGYLDLKHFNKNFKATTGMTPKAYRSIYS